MQEVSSQTAHINNLFWNNYQRLTTTKTFIYPVDWNCRLRMSDIKPCPIVLFIY